MLSAVRKIDGDMKFTLNLQDCPNVSQSNIHFNGNGVGYFVPLSCSISSASTGLRTCKADLTAIQLTPAIYEAKLYLAWSKQGEGSNTFEFKSWTMGTFDGSQLKPPAKSGTPDQQEDVFARLHEEIRPNYQDRHAKPTPKKPVEMLFVLILGAFFFALMSRWPSKPLGFNNIYVALFWTCFALWPMLAFSAWWSLDIFGQMKYGALLTGPTVFFAINALRSISKEN